MELGRHHVAGGDAVLLDQPQHLLGRPAVHQHHRVSEVHGGRGEHQHRGVIERRAADVDVAVLGLAAEEAEESAHQRRHRVGIERRERPAHALRAAGGARGVVHHLAGGAVLGKRRRLARRELGEGTEAGDVSDREARLRGQRELARRGGAGRREPLVYDQRLRLAVVHDVGDLGARQVMVDRGQEPAGLGRRQVELDHGRAVGQHGRDAVALLQPERAQPMHELVAARQQLAARPLAAVGVDQREMIRIAARKIPEAEVGHRGAPSPRMRRSGRAASLGASVEHVSSRSATTLRRRSP